MNARGDILERLAQLVGGEVRYQGMRCTVVELLEEPPVLVLRPIDAAPVIQADNFGKPARHAPQLYELPVFGADGCALSAELTLVHLPGSAAPAFD